MQSEPLHPAYFQVRFRTEQPPPEWPAWFAIMTAFATTGQQWSPETNHAADQRLRERLERLTLWPWRITGYSPLDGHSEPGWAISLPLEQARELGSEFRQDAIYWVVDDEMWVTKCTPGSELVPVGSFRERLDEPGKAGR